MFVRQLPVRPCAAFKLPIKTKFMMRLKRSRVFMLPKISEARNLSDEELAQAIIDVKSNYFSCGCKKPPGSWDKPHQFTALSTD